MAQGIVALAFGRGTRYDYETVLAAVSPLDAIERVRDGFVRYAADEWGMPPKVYLAVPPAGDFRAMPAQGRRARDPEVGHARSPATRRAGCRS